VQRPRVDVGGVDDRALKQPLLAEEDGQGIGFLAGAAAGHPQLQRRVGAQERDDALAQRLEVAGIAEHLADRHGQHVEDVGEGGRIVQHPILELRHGRARQPGHRGAHAALRRGLGIAAEVVVILQVDGVEQQPPLDVEVAGGHDRRPYFGIQTRTSDSSRSTSSGLAM
jgi:hypothetical protein